MSDDFATHIIEVIADQDEAIDTQNITRATSLKDDLKFDSFAAVTLMFALEEEFGIDISDNDIRELNTVGDVIDRVRKLCDTQAAAP